MGLRITSTSVLDEVSPEAEIVTVDYRLAREQLAAGPGAFALDEASQQEAD